MKRNQVIGGILFLVAAAFFMFSDIDASIPIAVALAVVGIALIAVSRRRSRQV